MLQEFVVIRGAAYLPRAGNGHFGKCGWHAGYGIWMYNGICCPTEFVHEAMLENSDSAWRMELVAVNAMRPRLTGEKKRAVNASADKLATNVQEVAPIGSQYKLKDNPGRESSAAGYSQASVIVSPTTEA